MSLSVRRMIIWLLKLRGGGGFLLLNVKCLSVRQVYCFLVYCLNVICCNVSLFGFCDVQSSVKSTVCIVICTVNLKSSFF